MRCGVPSALYSTVTWLLASGRANGMAPLFAHLGVVLHQAVRQVDRQRHQGVGFLAREAEHHALVAGAAGVHAHGDVRRLLVQVTHDLAGVGGEADGWVHVADLADDVADEAVDGRAAEVGVGGDLAATTARSVVTSVSQATRLAGSISRQWSRTASLIWSATLSGWPMETDSLVKRYRSVFTQNSSLEGGKAAVPGPARAIIRHDGAAKQSQLMQSINSSYFTLPPYSS